MYTQTSRKRNKKINIEKRNKKICDMIAAGAKQYDCAVKFGITPQQVSLIVREKKNNDILRAKFPEIYEAAEKIGATKNCRSRLIRAIISNGYEDIWMYADPEALGELRNIGELGKKLVIEAINIFKEKER